MIIKIGLVVYFELNSVNKSIKKEINNIAIELIYIKFIPSMG
jgi:hypothetical protein